MTDEQKLADFRNHIRTRSGMYIGSKDIRALHFMVESVVNKSLNKLISGACDRITVTLLDKNTISISDNGAGISISKYEDSDVSFIEIIMAHSGYFHPTTGRFILALHGSELAPINV